MRADLAEVGHDDEPVGDGQQHHVGRLQQARDAQRLEAVEGLVGGEDTVKTTTPIICQGGAHGVNPHPGSYLLVVDFDVMRVELVKIAEENNSILIFR